MKNPCSKCVVRACCTQRCNDYAVYLFKNRDYKMAGLEVADHIENGMTERQAIAHILMVENIYLSMKLEMPL